MAAHAFAHIAEFYFRQWAARSALRSYRLAYGKVTQQLRRKYTIYNNKSKEPRQ